ncbi:MAG: aminotransferase class I/II-fold pyridoxal phosphate-dependent enzyme, partial [Candidatus Caldatribacteriaceae bacterium]
MNANPHGGRRIELQQSGKQVLLDLSASINPFGPPEVLRRRWGELWSFVKDYPPLDFGFYQERIARIYGFSPSMIVPCNGATQGIYLLSRVLPVKRVLILEPLFTEYARAFALAGKEIFHLVLSPGCPFEELVGTLKRECIDAVVLGNPSNPLGDTEGVEIYHRLREVPHFEALFVIVDEAFQEFLGEETSVSPYLPRDPRLYLVRSLTKYYALPGLRGGFLLADAANAAHLLPHLEPWSVNGVLAGALDMLSKEDLSTFHEFTRENLSREKEFLEVNLKQWAFLEYFPSRAN